MTMDFIKNLLHAGAFAACLTACSGEPAGAPKPPSAAARQNDTGIRYSGNHPRTINDGCIPGTIDLADEWLMGEVFAELTLRGQDCETGRDAASQGAAPDADGHAGFAFAKIAVDGAPLPADSTAWDCVLDQVTGLMWEAKVAGDGQVGNAGQHDADDLFTWYNTDTATNGGNIGNWNRDGADCAGYQAGAPETFCNTQALVARVNAAKLCSYSDWRVPTLRELSGLVNFGRNQPALDTAYFPHLVPWAYWSSQAAAEFPAHARLMNFRFGMIGVGMRIDRNHVVLVRGPGENP